MANDNERLAYQITVIEPGKRSQNWQGVLYDASGKPMQVEPGKTVTTRFGEFLSVAPASPWTPFGMIHVDMVKWMKTHSGNVIMDDEPWAYRVIVEREGSRSEGWRGELLHGHSVIAAPTDDKPLATPMGPYRWIKRQQLWGPLGWFHVSWSNIVQAPQRAERVEQGA